MRDPTWHTVVLAALTVLQALGLAYIGKRGVVLPPANRRRPRSDRRDPPHELDP